MVKIMDEKLGNGEINRNPEEFGGDEDERN